MINLTEITKQIRAKDPSVRRSAASELCRMLCDAHAPTDEILRLGLLLDLIQVLKRDDADTQLSAAWALSNVASGNELQTKAAASAGLIPVLVSLLQSDAVALKEQAVWGLANLAGGSVSRRDALLQAGALPPVVGLLLTSLKDEDKEALSVSYSPSMVETCTWALSNFCSGNPLPHFPLVHPAVVPFTRVLAQARDVRALESASWGLSFLTARNRGREALRAHLPTVIRALLSSSSSAQTLAGVCRVAGNMASGSQAQTTALVKANFFSAAAFQLAQWSGKGLVKELCYTISNIFAESGTHVDSIWEKGVMTLVCSHLDGLDLRDGVQKEILYAILHVSLRSSSEQVSTLVRSCAFFSSLPVVLLSADNQIVELGLDILSRILSVENLCSDHIPWEDLCERTGNFDAIDSLIQRGIHSENYVIALRIRTLFFSTVCARRQTFEALSHYRKNLLPLDLVELIVRFAYRWK